MSRILQFAVKTFRPRAPIPGKSILDPSVTQMRVNVTDLDLLFHVNNGTYLQMADVGRWDYIADLDGIRRLRAKGWYPVVAAATVKYKKSMKLGQQFTITTQLVGWDERCVYLEQVFAEGDQVFATVWIASRFLAKGGKRLVPTDVIELLSSGDAPESPELPGPLLAWAQAMDVAPR